MKVIAELGDYEDDVWVDFEDGYNFHRMRQIFLLETEYCKYKMQKSENPGLILRAGTYLT